MKSYASIVLMLTSLSVYADPFLVSDVLTPGVSQCGVYLDTAARVVIPVTPATAPAVGNICKFDVGSVANGNHTVQLTAITIADPVWGSQESAKSSPLAFVRPGVPAAPSGLTLTR